MTKFVCYFRKSTAFVVTVLLLWVMSMIDATHAQSCSHTVDLDPLPWTVAQVFQIYVNGTGVFDSIWLPPWPSFNGVNNYYRIPFNLTSPDDTSVLESALDAIYPGSTVVNGVISIPSLSSDQFYVRILSEPAYDVAFTQCAAAVCGDGTEDPGEECDDWNTDTGDGCNDVCDIESAVCGSWFLQDYNYPSGPLSLDLCGISSVVSGSISYLPGTGWTWICNNSLWWGWKNAVSCSATEVSTCGDGYLTYSDEQCDDWNSDNNDACDNTCLLNIPSCSDTELLQLYFYRPDEPTQYCNTWFVMSSLTTPNVSPPFQWNRTWECLNPLRDAYDEAGEWVFCSVIESYCGDDVVDTEFSSEECDDGLENGVACTAWYNSQCTYCNNTCDQLITVTWPFCGDGICQSTEEDIFTCGSDCSAVAVCGPAMTNSYYDPAWPSVGELCTGWSVLTGSLNTSLWWLFTWECVHPVSSHSVECSNQQQRCGDDIINGPEQCDGTMLSGASCTTLWYTTWALGCFPSGPNKCTYNTGSCVNVAALDCGELDMQLVLNDLWYPRINPYLSEQFHLDWTQPVSSGTSIQSIMLGTGVLWTGATGYTGAINTTWTTNLSITLFNSISAETRVCNLPITIVKYTHQKDVYLSSFNNDNWTVVMTYYIPTSLPQGMSSVSLSDQLASIPIFDGYLDIRLSSLRLLNQQGDAVSTWFTITTGSVQWYTGVVTTGSASWYVFNYWFNTTIEPVVVGDYGEFILAYDVEVLNYGDEICNTCIAWDTGWWWTTSFLFDKVYAQTYFDSADVCVTIPHYDPVTPSCQSCPSGYVGCPVRTADPSWSGGQASVLYWDAASCNQPWFCECYQNTPPDLDDRCIGLPQNSQICNSTPVLGWWEQYYSPVTPFGSSCPVNAPSCSYACAPGAVNVNGQCVVPSCDVTTIPTPPAWTPAPIAEICQSNATQLNESYQFSTEAACPPSANGCFFFYQCPFGFTWEWTATAWSCVRELAIQKVGSGIVGSIWTYTVTISLPANATLVDKDYTFTDTLTTAPNGDTITDIQLLATNGACTATAAWATVPWWSAGCEVRLTVTANLPQWWDDDVINQACVSWPEGQRCGSATLDGYHLAIDKVALTWYDSDFGWPLNTYPSTGITAGQLHDGDRVVYRITVTNIWPEDAMSPRITDTLPVWLTIVDFLTGWFTGWGTVPSAGAPTMNANGFTVQLNGKFFVGQTYTMEFSARFDQDALPYTAGSSVCNDVMVRGENTSNDRNNASDQMCLTVPPCGPRQCSAEIYAMNIQNNVSPWPNGTTIATIQWECRIEWTCELAWVKNTNVVTLTYATCAWSINANGQITTSIDGTTHTSPQGQSTGDIVAFLAWVDTTVKPWYVNINLSSLAIAWNSFSYSCRTGDPVLTCGQQLCGGAPQLSQQWIIGEGSWAEPLSLIVPDDGDQAPQWNGDETNFTCNTCTTSPDCTGPSCPPDDSDPFCTGWLSPIISTGGQISCGTCLACGCCANGALITVEYSLTGVNGQTGYQIVDTFCPDPVGSVAPYTGRSYDIYPATDTDGDGKPDMCVLFNKTVVGISWSVISYQIQWLVSSGDSISFVDTLSTGASFIAWSVTMTSSSGTGSLWATINGQQLQLTVTNQWTWVLNYTIRYNATMAASGQTCNSIVSTSSWTNLSDSTCSCPSGYQYCALTNQCLPDGELCGFDKQIVSIVGNTINYRLSGVVHSGVNSVSIVDSISGASYVNNFVLTTVWWSGTLNSAIVWSSVTLTVNKTSGTAISFSISYSATATWTTNNAVPVCNDARFSAGTTTYGTDRECACPSGSYYCALTNTCVLEGEPCGYDKRIVSISGNRIDYEIMWQIANNATGMTIIDVLSSGANYSGNAQLFVSSWSGSFVRTINTLTNSATFVITRNWGSAFVFSIRYSVAANRSYMGIEPRPVCNDISFWWAIYDRACVCPDGWSYCPVEDRCVPVWTPCSSVGSVCQDLVVTPTTTTGNVLTWNYQCIGTGTSYQFTIYSGAQTLFTANTASGTFTLTGAGNYTGMCTVNGDSGVQCGNWSLSCGQIDALASSIVTSLWSQWLYLTQVFGSALPAQVINCSGYVDLTQSQLVTKLQTDTYAYFIAQMIALYPPIPTTTPLPNVQLTLLQQAQLTINTSIVSIVTMRCSESCIVWLQLWTWWNNGWWTWYCGALTTSSALTVNSANHSVAFSCQTNQASWWQQVVISCGNGTWGTIYSGQSVLLGSWVYGLTGTCSYSGYGSYTATCSVQNTTNNSCQQQVRLSGGWGWWWGCGNGRLDAGEQCDDGNRLDGDSCPADCTYDCGNGIKEWSEICDDGNLIDTDSCRNNCTTPWWWSSGGWSSWWWSSGGWGWGGSNRCAKWGLIDAKYCVNNEPKCSEIDPPSVMLGEYLPFRWDLDLGNEVDKKAKTCSDLRAGKTIPGSSLLCSFELYNGASQNPIAKIDNVPCLQDRWDERGVFLFNDLKTTTPGSPLWSNWVQLTAGLTKGVVGEYQIVLSSVKYATCEGWTSKESVYKWVSNERVCAMNFAVADSYLIHQWASFSVLENTNLRNYRLVDGRAVLDRDTLRNLQRSSTASYPGDEVQKIVWDWVNKQTKLATKKASLGQYTSASLKVTSAWNVYVYDGGPSREPIRMRGWDVSAKKFTVIVRNADLIIEWSLAWRNMYVVAEGKIHFVNIDCDKQDSVEWILMTTEGFSTDRIRNDKLWWVEWCEDGRLVIEGMAVWPGMNEGFVESRRARLERWFDVSKDSQEQKVFDAASVLLKTDPKLWIQLPPGADAFIRQLQIGNKQ